MENYNILILKSRRKDFTYSSNYFFKKELKRIHKLKRLKYRRKKQNGKYRK